MFATAVFPAALPSLSQTAEAKPDAKPAAVDYRETIDRLEHAVREELARGQLPGVSVALVDDQRLAYVRGFGMADRQRGILAGPRTVYRAGSISKLFNALAVMQLVEQGKLDLDRPVAAYDPQFRIVVPFPEAGPITLRQLLCHRSGMVRESPVGGYFDPLQPTIAATVASVAPCVLVHPPGKVTKYSNVGPTIAGRVVELVSGMPYAEYQRHRVLGPMGMNNSGFLLNDDLRAHLAAGAMRVAEPGGKFKPIVAPHFELGTLPAGNLFTTAEDLARLVSLVLADGRAGDRPIVKPETLRQMLTVQLSDEKNGFGLGFSLDRFRGHRTIGHTGAVYGFTSSILVLPEEKVGAVVLANDDIATGLVRKLAETSVALLLEAKRGEKPPAKEPPPVLSPAEVVAVLGDYESESYWARIERAGDRLVTNISGQPLDLAPSGPLTFTADGRFACHAPMVFQRDAAGRITGFELLAQRFRRVGPPGEVPADWLKFAGSYGPDFIPLIVSVRHGHLYAMTENMVDYRLTPLNRTVFKMPPGMYVDEHLVFQAGADGRVHSALLANMLLPRKPPQP